MNRTFRLIIIGVFSAVAAGAADMKAVLDSSDGSSAFRIQDSDSNDVLAVTSDGQATLTGRASLSDTADRGWGPRTMLPISGGEDVEIGVGANGYYNGVAVGYHADGYYYGTAVGRDAIGGTQGAAVGHAANGQGNGAALGRNANGCLWGATLGNSANSYFEGVAVGGLAQGNNSGVAVGYLANGAGTNVAVGVGASASGGVCRTAIGPYVTNTVDNSARLRGTLYLDGGTAVLYRSTFGSGAWASWSDVFVKKAGDTMTGSLTVNTNVSLSYTANRGSGNRALLTIGGGNDVEIGGGANAYWSGVALGYQANGYWAGAALGYQADANQGGVAMGYNATGAFSGVAVGQAANGSTDGAAIGRQANGSSDGAAVGREANGANAGVAVGRYADGANYGTAVGCGAVARDYCLAVGYGATSTNYGTALGVTARAQSNAVAIGNGANAGNFGSIAIGHEAYAGMGGVGIGDRASAAGGLAVGPGANGDSGLAIGPSANGFAGTAVGVEAQASLYGVAVGYCANGAGSNVAVGIQANARGGLNRTAVGPSVDNDTDNSVRLRGDLYLDGGSSTIRYRAAFGTGGWSVKAFAIDHPLDPENKVLRHYCMEGPEVWNVYAGNATLVNGEAVVELPDYYAALNLAGSEIYQLTPVGDLAQVCVKEKAAGNRFVIRGDKDVEVSWTIKVRRNDPACLEDLARRPVEQSKGELAAGQLSAENQTVNTAAVSR